MRLLSPLRHVLYVFFPVLFMMSVALALPVVHPGPATRDTDGNPSSDQSHSLSPVAAVAIAVAVCEYRHFHGSRGIQLDTAFQ